MRRHLIKAFHGERGPLIWYCGAKQDQTIKDRLVDLTGNGFDLKLIGVSINASGIVNFTRWVTCGICEKPFRLGDFTIICRRTNFIDNNGYASSNAVVSKSYVELHAAGSNFLPTAHGGIRLESGFNGKRACAVNGTFTVDDSVFAANGIAIMTNDCYHMYGCESKISLATGTEADSYEYKLVVNSCKADSSRFTLAFNLYDLIIFNRKLREDEVTEVVETMINV